MSDIKEDAPETVPAKKKGVSFSVRAKTITAVAIASLIVVLSSSFTGYVLRQDSLLEEFQILTKSIASTGAIGISGDDLKLIRSNQDVLEPEFQFARERLEAIRDANGLRSEEIYILRPINMEAFETEFVVMPGDEPFVGNVYNIRPENRQAFQTAFRDGKISGTNIYEDEHGTWISAYAPIFDLDGKVEAVLEVDAEISRFLERAQQEFLQVLAVGLGAFLFALIPGIYLVNRVTAGLRVIKSALDQFEGGDEKTNVQLNTRDELEDVARSFNEMTSKLAESRENLVSTNISLQNRTNELNQSLTLTNTIMSTVQESLML
ncbi:MAG: HAMP domain-containing protein, partial [Verrucomicrobiota bacterium]